MIRCDAPDFSLCPGSRGRWYANAGPEFCDSWGGFLAQAMRDLGVDEWTPDVDPAAEEMHARWWESAALCAGDAPARCVVEACALPSPAAAAERGQ